MKDAINSMSIQVDIWHEVPYIINLYDNSILKKKVESWKFKRMIYCPFCGKFLIPSIRCPTCLKDCYAFLRCDNCDEIYFPTHNYSYFSEEVLHHRHRTHEEQINNIRLSNPEEYELIAKFRELKEDL
jgi:RNase P subunit RPR2